MSHARAKAGDAQQLLPDITPAGGGRLGAVDAADAGLDDADGASFELRVPLAVKRPCGAPGLRLLGERAFTSTLSNLARLPEDVAPACAEAGFRASGTGEQSRAACAMVTLGRLCRAQRDEADGGQEL